MLIITKKLKYNTAVVLCITLFKIQFAAGRIAALTAEWIYNSQF